MRVAKEHCLDTGLVDREVISCLYGGKEVVVPVLIAGGLGDYGSHVCTRLEDVIEAI